MLGDSVAKPQVLCAKYSSQNAKEHYNVALNWGRHICVCTQELQYDFHPWTLWTKVH